MAHESDNTSKLVWFFAGAAIGATIALLYAPASGEEMRRKSLEKTPHALISRAVAGIRGTSLIVNLPGSPKGAIENLEAVWPAIPHAVAKIQGDKSDCAPN